MFFFVPVIINRTKVCGKCDKYSAFKKSSIETIRISLVI